MYGFNSPQGFVPFKSDTNAVLASALKTFPIKNGYAQNIFTGDPVIILRNSTTPPSVSTAASSGYMGSLFDASNTVASYAYADYPLLGIFMGVSYKSAADVTNPDLPMRTYWPASTNTADGLDPVGYYLPTNYEYGFTIQSTLIAPAPTMVGDFATVNFVSDSGLVQGNVPSGQSKCSITLSPMYQYPSGNTFQVESIDYSQGVSGATVPYGNVIVRLANSAWPVVCNV